jgi:hypothetical protein
MMHYFLPTPNARIKSLDLPIVQHQHDTLIARYVDLTSHSRILSTSSCESGAWLSALPISSLGHCMLDESVCTAIDLGVCMLPTVNVTPAAPVVSMQMS